MSYMTRYDGKIEIYSEKCKKMIKLYILDDSENEYGDTLFESTFDEYSDTLTIDEDRRNYNEEMESIFDLIVFYDKRAEGVIDAIGEDGEGRERFTIKNGRVINEKGYIAYKDREDITDMPWNIEEINEIMVAADKVCDCCKDKLNLKSFNFETRGYYNDIIDNTKYKDLCKKCYTKIKVPFAEKRKLELELQKKEEEISSLR